MSHSGRVRSPMTHSRPSEPRSRSAISSRGAEPGEALDVMNDSFLSSDVMNDSFMTSQRPPRTASGRTFPESGRTTSPEHHPPAGKHHPPAREHQPPARMPQPPDGKHHTAPLRPAPSTTPSPSAQPDRAY